MPDPIRGPILMSALLLFGSVVGEAAAAEADYRIFFSRSFPGSVPEYFEVVVDSSGEAVYREDHEEEPLTFEIPAADVEWLLERVENLDFFETEVASSRKVAFTGDKTLRYEGPDGNHSEIRFNHTENADAKELLSWFHRVSESERHLMELERTARFDRLGVNKTLLLFQMSFDKGRVVAPRQFLPILNRIAKDKKIVHIARSRAAALIERIEKIE